MAKESMDYSIALPEVPHGQTPYTLALGLPDLCKRRDALDLEALQASQNMREKNTVDFTFTAIQHRIAAVIDMIIETPAHDLADAAAQLLAAFNELENSGDIKIEGARRAVISAFFVVAEFAGIKLDEIAFENLAPYCVAPPQGTFVKTL